MKIFLIGIAILALLVGLAALISGLLNKTCHYEVQTTIKATPNQIFPFLTETTYLKQWVSGLVDSQVIRGSGTEPGAVALMTIKEGDRIMKMESEVLEVVANKRLVVRLTSLDGPKYQGVSNYQLQEENGQTRLTANMDFELGSFFLRAMAPLFKMIGNKNLCSDFDKLKKLVESNHASTL